MNADWETKSGDCAVCGAHTAKYPLCDACWSECIDAGDEYCGASSAWIVDKVRARCAQVCADRDEDEAMSGTCADCEHSKEPPCAKCPLPRVGSKEWGWTKSNVCVWSSPKTDLTVVGDGVYSDCCVRNKNRDLIADCIERLSTAKRIAELLTRLDWKRESKMEKSNG